MPLVPGLKVIRSKIHGYGVVATRAFAEGEVIAEVEGIVLSRDELGDDEYCLWVDGELFLDMVDQTRWINHSCEPNADVEARADPAGGASARLIANCDIAVGDEITYDYGFALEHACPCSCGAETCRGWIVDEELLPELKAKRASAAADRPSRSPPR